MSGFARWLMAGFAAVLLFAGAGAESTAVADSTPIYIDDSGRALRGYDTVAYFTEGAPMPGSAEFAHDWNGATWLFASAAHRDAFAAEPERYAPQYGGYCAYAITRGNAREARPDVWSIVDGKLYLNLGPGAQKRWKKDIRGNIVRADANWPGALVDAGRRSTVPDQPAER